MQSLSALRHWYNATRYLQNLAIEGVVCLLYIPYWIGYWLLAKLNWDSQLGKLFSLPSQRNFPISFKPKVAIAKFIGKMQKKSGIMKSGLDAMPLFLLDNLLN